MVSFFTNCDCIYFLKIYFSIGSLRRWEVGIPSRITRGLGGERCSRLKGRGLVWNAHQWGEETWVEFNSSRKTGNQVEGWGCHPTVKNSDLALSLSKRTAGIKKWRRYRKKRSSDLATLGSISRGRLQDLTLLLMLWCSYRQEPSMAVLQEANQIADSYTPPMDWSQGPLWLNKKKDERSCGGGQPYRKTSSLN